MGSTTHTVRIAAPPADVWRELVDVESWPRFAPRLKAIERLDAGPLRPGSKGRITPHGPRVAVWTVTEFSDGRSFTWRADPFPGLHLIARHNVEPEEGGTKVTLALEWTGPVAPIIGPLLASTLRENVRTEAEGLKELCERR